MDIEFFEEWKDEGISVFDNDGWYAVHYRLKIVADDITKEEAFEIAQRLYDSRNRCGCLMGCSYCLMLEV